MDFYLAIDHETGALKDWTFVKLKGCKTDTIREARNWFINHNHSFPKVFCGLIMKKTKKGVYKMIEQVFPRGTSYEKKDIWNLADEVFTKENTFEL